MFMKGWVDCDKPIEAETDEYEKLILQHTRHFNAYTDSRGKYHEEITQKKFRNVDEF